MSKSYLERITDALIVEANLPIPISEFRLCEHRRWKCDYVWITSERKVILEIEGGVWNGGRHVSGKGFTADCEKYNEAALMGFIVLRATKFHLINGQAIAWVKKALQLP